MTLVAHGGLGGLLVEGLLAASVVGIFVVVWLRERRGGRSRGENGPGEAGPS